MFEDSKWRSGGFGSNITKVHKDGAGQMVLLMFFVGALCAISCAFVRGVVTFDS